MIGRAQSRKSRSRSDLRSSVSKASGERGPTAERKSSSKQPSATLRLGTLFSGIGAVEHALRRLRLRHEIVFAGDIDPHVKKTYFTNYQISEERWHTDARTFHPGKSIGRVDLLVGGSPCQSFSMVGSREGLDDSRGALIFEFIRVVKQCKPQVFIFENVKGLLNHGGGRTWELINEAFESVGYSTKSAVLNSRDYGIPQNRQRLFVVGIKTRKTDFEFPKPIALKSRMQDFLEDVTDSKFFLRSKGVKFVTSSKNRLKRYTQINGDVALCQKANQQFNWHGDFVFEPSSNQLEPDEFTFDVRDVEEKYYLSDAVRRYVLAPGTKGFRTATETDLKVARPLLQSMHKMHRAGIDNYVTHSGRIRKLTPRECLRLMGFRDDFKITVSDMQMYRQAGNSIVVDVLIAILRELDIAQFASGA